MPTQNFDQSEIGLKLKALRKERRFSLRKLASRAGLTPGFISLVESGKTSPSIISLQKILEALELSVAEFFTDSAEKATDAVVFRHQDMKVLEDEKLKWIFAFPPEPDIDIILSCEEYLPETLNTELEWHTSDICGYIVEGTLTLEIKDRGIFTAGKGDAFYITEGLKHITNNNGSSPLVMITAKRRKPLKG